MRTLLLVSTALVLAACSDNPQPTAPRSIGSATSGAGDLTRRTAIQPNAKPVDQIGFTTVTKVISLLTAVGPNSMVSATATCPVGSTVISGSYRVAGNITGVPLPLVIWSEDDQANGWHVTLDNTQPGSALVSLWAVAYCAS